MTIDTTQRNVITIDTTGLEQAAAAVERELIAQFCEKQADLFRGANDELSADACNYLANAIRRGAYKEGKG